MLLPPVVRAIFFDAVGTLIHPEPSAAAVYTAVGRRHGSRLTEATIAARFRVAFEREEAIDRTAGWRTSEAREVERWRCIVATVLDDVDDPDGCFRELFAHFSLPDAWRSYADAIIVLEALSSRSYRLGIASNYDRRLRRVLAGHPELAAAGHLAISSEIGWRKPAREFFTALCTGIELPPEQVLLVGDDMINDYEGARDAGLNAILLDSEGEAHYSQRTCIRQLRQLLA